MFKKYWGVTKPGIIFGNLITTIGGFFLGASGELNFTMLFATTLGISLVIASACVLNNCVDRDIDALMERTKNRAMVQQTISIPIALFYGTALGLLGITLLLSVNYLAAIFGAIGWFFYVVPYTLYFKRKSIYGTLVGSISGAMPIIVGYVASCGHFNLGVVILFAILAIWQMPHSYAIAIFRLDDYKRAEIKVLPVVHGIKATKAHMLFWSILFLIANIALSLFGYTGIVYLVISTLMSLLWIYEIYQGIHHAKIDDFKWAKRVFGMSILIITTLSVIMGLNYL